MKTTHQLITEQPAQLGELLASPPKATGFSIQAAMAASTKDADKNRNVLIIGAGDAYQKLMRRVFDHRGAERYIFDTNPKATAALNGAQEHSITSLDCLPIKPDYVMVLTPGASHFEYIEWAFKHNLPVVVEKPIVVAKAHAEQLDALLKQPHPPLYCIDWAIEHAKPLMHALGAPVSFADTLVSPAAEKPSFDIDQINSIRARWLHHMSTSEEQAYQVRNWTKDISQGAGQLWDNGVHLLNPLSVAGLEFTSEPPVAHLGDKNNRKGTYNRITDSKAEEYARVEGKMQWRPESGHRTPEGGIRATIEVGWNALRNEHFMEMADKNGNLLRWDMKENRVEYLDKHKKVEKIIALNDSDCYDRILAHAAQFVTSAANRDQALYAPEQLSVIRSIADMQIAARAPSDAGEKVFSLQAFEVEPDVTIRTRSGR